MSRALRRIGIVGLHALALAVMAGGLLLWEAEGAAIWRDAIFSFCA